MLTDRTHVIEEYELEVGLPEGVNEPFTPYQGKQFSDYVLLGKDGKPLAVVEAKKTSVDAAIGREQAKQYCYNIQKQLVVNSILLLYKWSRYLFLGFRKLSSQKSTWLSDPR